MLEKRDKLTKRHRHFRKDRFKLLRDESGRKFRSGSPLEVLLFQFEIFSQIPNLKHGVYTRVGGVSESAFHSLNVSYQCGDEPENVRSNIQIIMETIDAEQLIHMNQIHKNDVCVIRPNTPAATGGSISADALVTDVRDTALLVKLADCQGVILFDPLKRVVSNAHCGWRGNTHDILGSTVARMEADFGCKRSNIMAAIGPSLGPCCAEFVTHEELFPKSFKRFMVRKNYFDFWEISRWQLVEAGLRNENIEVAGVCNRCRTDLFYSYRGEGTTGRFSTVVMLTKN